MQSNSELLELPLWKSSVLLSFVSLCLCFHLAGQVLIKKNNNNKIW